MIHDSLLTLFLFDTFLFPPFSHLVYFIRFNANLFPKLKMNSNILSIIDELKSSQSFSPPSSYMLCHCVFMLNYISCLTRSSSDSVMIGYIEEFVAVVFHTLGFMHPPLPPYFNEFLSVKCIDLRIYMFINRHYSFSKECTLDAADQEPFHLHMTNKSAAPSTQHILV